MAVAALKFITEEEYLTLEDASEEKHEYYNGRIYAMAGGRPDHALITASVVTELGLLAKGSDCRVFSSDLRIRVSLTGLYTYPDVSVVCGELQATDHDPAAATNPALIVEVLSPSTMHYDRGEKWRHYQGIESLRDYLLIWHDRPRVEHYSRIAEGGWKYSLIEGIQEQLAVLCLSGKLALSDIFNGVEFPPSPPLRIIQADEAEELLNGNS